MRRIFPPRAKRGGGGERAKRRETEGAMGDRKAPHRFASPPQAKSATGERKDCRNCVHNPKRSDTTPTTGCDGVDGSVACR